MNLASRLTDQDLIKVFNEYKPWITKFWINKKAYGGEFDAMNDIRVNQFFESFPYVKAILELGSLEGGHTFALSIGKGVESVVAIEGRKSNIDKACSVQRILNIHNVKFINTNLESYDLESAGQFDAVYCVGVLYHLPKPWELIEKISHVTKNLFIWTHYTNDRHANTVLSGYKGYIYKEAGIVDPLSGLSADSFWPTMESLKLMLSKYGFTKLRIIENNQNHEYGPCVTIAAVHNGVSA